MKTKKANCEQCEEDLSNTNPKFVLEQIGILGYEEFKFCSKKCFIKNILKEFRKDIQKELELEEI